MGKKFKKKARSAHKEKGILSSSLRSIPVQSSPTAEVENETVLVVKERKPCNHIDKGIDLGKISSKIGDESIARCEDCRDGFARERRMGKGRVGKQGKKNGGGSYELKSEPKGTWICLECGHFACGGTLDNSKPTNHALRHARQTRHPCVVQFDNPLLSWCFSCNSMIIAGKAECGERNDLLYEAQEFIKKYSSKKDVEDIWFGGDGQEKKNEIVESAVLPARSYLVGGLVNLGNTCFFNSVMQNLLALNILRSHFLSMEQSNGPLTIALKKLFYETSCDSSDMKGCISPKAVFGCICSKAPQFRGYQQQDSHELLRYLLDRLHTEELGARKALTCSEATDAVSVPIDTPTFVDLLFGGQLSSTVRCVECAHASIVYEPFLDLSLPIPVKKLLSKKAPATCLKKKKIKDSNKSGKFRGRQKSNEACKPIQAVALVGLPSECSSYSCVSEPDKLDMKVTEQRTLSAEMDGTWLDYLGMETLSDNSAGSVSGVVNSTNMQALYNEDVNQSTCELLNNVCSLNHDESPKGERRDDVLDSGVLLLPYKDTVSVTEGTAALEEALHNVRSAACEDTSFKDVNAISSSVNGWEWEQTELEFDGFGDLFNEPEAISDAKSTFRSNASNSQAEYVGLALFDGNSSDSNQDEVDNFSSEISIDSCLTYFTKPELLSDEHAWHCENCSKILQHRLTLSSLGKGQVLARPKRSNSSNYKVNEGKVAALRDGDSISDEKSANVSGSSIPLSVRVGSESDIAEQDLLNHVDEMNYNACECGKIGDGKDPDFLRPMLNGLNHCYVEKFHSYEDIDTSKNAFQSISCTSCNNEIAICVNSDVSNKESAPVSSNGRDILSKFDKMSYNAPQSSEGNEMSDGEHGNIDPSSIKVKRNATKQFLISKAPPILTIHLKRFGQDSRGRLSKLSGHVCFGETLDLSPYMDSRIAEKEKCKYRLVGVVEHSGTMKGGHYVAYIKGIRSRGKFEREGGGLTWFHISDSYVREVSLAEVLQTEAYILFYEKM